MLIYDLQHAIIFKITQIQTHYFAYTHMLAHIFAKDGEGGDIFILRDIKRVLQFIATLILICKLKE